MVDKKYIFQKNTLYLHLLAEYEREKATYQEAQREYDRKVSALRSESNLSEYRRELFEEWKSRRFSQGNGRNLLVPTDMNSDSATKRI